MKGLRASILKDARIGTCANGGISDRFDQVTVIIDDDPSAAVFEATPDAPAVRLVARDFAGGRIVHAEPVDGVPGAVGPMMGGSFISTSDSRFGAAVRRLLGGSFYGAVALHDRFETPAEYEALSR